MREEVYLISNNYIPMGQQGPRKGQSMQMIEAVVVATWWVVEHPSNEKKKIFFKEFRLNKGTYTTKCSTHWHLIRPCCTRTIHICTSNTDFLLVFSITWCPLMIFSIKPKIIQLIFTIRIEYIYPIFDRSFISRFSNN